MTSNSEILFQKFNAILSEFNKSYLILKQYNKDLLIMNEDKYLEQLQIVHPLIESTIQNIKDMSALILSLETSEINDTKMKIKFIELNKQYNNKIKPKQTEVSIILKEIAYKEKTKFESASEFFIKKDYEIEKNKKGDLDSQYKESLLNMKTALNDTAFIESILIEKRKELENIEKISRQVKEITDFMGVKVKESDNILNNIEQNIVVAKNHAIMANEEVVIADKRNSKLKKKLIVLSTAVILIIIILLAVFFISIKR